jgi:hypothetical protein
MLSVIVLTVIMVAEILSIVKPCHYADSHDTDLSCAKCHNAECLNTEFLNAAPLDAEFLAECP